MNIQETIRVNSRSCQSWPYNGWSGSKGAAKYWEIDHILNNSNILKRSLSINIPHRVMCTFVLLKWIYGIHKKCSLLHFNTVTVIQTVVIVYILHCYIDNMTKHFDYLVCKQWHKDFSFWWHWYVHKYLLLRDELKILSKLQAFAGNPLCGAVCTNCFEKCSKQRLLCKY